MSCNTRAVFDRFIGGRGAPFIVMTPFFIFRRVTVLMLYQKPLGPSFMFGKVIFGRGIPFEPPEGTFSIPAAVKESVQERHVFFEAGLGLRRPIATKHCIVKKSVGASG
jgi:hypothetical protein